MPDVLPLDRRRLMALGASGAAAAILPGCATMTAASPRQSVWTFDRLADIGGIETTNRDAGRCLAPPIP